MLRERSWPDSCEPLAGCCDCFSSSRVCGADAEPRVDWDWRPPVGEFVSITASLAFAWVAQIGQGRVHFAAEVSTGSDRCSLQGGETSPTAQHHCGRATPFSG